MTPLPSSSFLFLALLVYVRALKSYSLQSSISSANASGPLFSNTSSTSYSSFSYIIPYGQTQDCDIYGPTCQTGSITVAVNLTTATTTTVLPCSSYLSAQSTYLGNASGYQYAEDGWWHNDVDSVDDPILASWNINFGQSPECRSFAEAWDLGQYTYSNCGSSNTVTQTVDDWLLPQVPPGVPRYFDPEYQGTCCGNCSLDVPAVRLYYFPDKASIDCYNNQTFNGTSALTARGLEKRVHSLIANGSTAIINGHTFTSPSLYLQLLGTATMNDRCTTVGPKLIDPIITLPPGGLSTWRPAPLGLIGAPGWDNYTVGEIWNDPTDIPGYDENLAGMAPLDVRGLACPTWGLGTSTFANGSVITTIGPPWLPLIVPPINMFTLDPTWSSLCTGIYIPFGDVSTFALFDPPIALTPAPLLLPTPPARPTPAPAPADPTLVPNPTEPSTEAAKPASLPNDPAAPAKTGNPGKNIRTQSHDTASADPAGSANLPKNSMVPSQIEGDPLSYPPSDPPPDLPLDPKVPSVGRDPPSSKTQILTSGYTQQPPADPKVPIVPVPQPVRNPQTQAQGLGAIIYNAFGKIGPEPDGLSTLLPSQSVFAAGAQTLTVNSTGFKINGATVAPGGTAQIVDNTIISLDKSGVLTIGSSIVSLANPLTTPVLAMAGQTFTPNLSAFFIAGTIVSIGGPAVIVDGTIISLGQSGALAIGSSTIDLPTSFYNSFGQAYTVAGQIFTPSPSAFSVAGTTISAGGSAVTVGGTIISLEPSGILIIGSNTIPFLPQTAFLSDVDIDGFNVIAHSSFAVVDGVTVSATAAGVFVPEKVFSLEAGGATLNTGTERFVLPTPVAGTSGSVNVQAFVGGQSKGLGVSVYLVWGVCGALMLYL